VSTGLFRDDFPSDSTTYHSKVTVAKSKSELSKMHDWVLCSQIEISELEKIFHQSVRHVSI